MTRNVKNKSIVNYYSAIPTEFKLDGGAMFGIIPKPLWEKKIPSDDQNRINMALRVLIIQTKNRLIIIDSGVGDYHPDSFKDRHGVNSSQSPLVSLLQQQLNITPEQVTDIIPSHMHFDHIGGFSEINEQNIVEAVFPNATLHLHEKHYQYALKPNKRDAGSFQNQFFEPLIKYYKDQEKINWLNQEKGEILQDPESNYTLNFLCSHGHTPFHIHPCDQKMIFMGDLVPTSAHISPVWVIGYDMQPMLCPDERIGFYDIIQEHGLTMVFDHDLKYWGSQVEFIKDSKGREKYMSKNLMNQDSANFQQILEDQ